MNLPVLFLLRQKWRRTRLEFPSSSHRSNSSRSMRSEHASLPPEALLTR